jgi:hypothetical protein
MPQHETPLEVISDFRDAVQAAHNAADDNRTGLTVSVGEMQFNYLYRPDAVASLSFYTDLDTQVELISEDADKLEQITTFSSPDRRQHVFGEKWTAEDVYHTKTLEENYALRAARHIAVSPHLARASILLLTTSDQELNLKKLAWRATDKKALDEYLERERETTRLRITNQRNLSRLFPTTMQRRRNPFNRVRAKNNGAES